MRAHTRLDNRMWKGRRFKEPSRKERRVAFGREKKRTENVMILGRHSA
jgi:hypothetical protein